MGKLKGERKTGHTQGYVACMHVLYVNKNKMQEIKSLCNLIQSYGVLFKIFKKRLFENS